MLLYLPATQSVHSEAPNHRDRTPMSAPAISRRSPALATSSHECVHAVVFSQRMFTGMVTFTAGMCVHSTYVCTHSSRYSFTIVCLSRMLSLALSLSMSSLALSRISLAHTHSHLNAHTTDNCSPTKGKRPLSGVGMGDVTHERTWVHAAAVQPNVTATRDLEIAGTSRVKKRAKVIDTRTPARNALAYSLLLPPASPHRLPQRQRGGTRVTD